MNSHAFLSDFSALMDNRRQTYRHFFDPAEALRVELHLPGKQGVLDCTLLDLSLGGMRLQTSSLPDAIRIGDSVTVRLLGREAPNPVVLSLALPARIVHLRQEEAATFCGVQFMPTASPSANANAERTLATFLLAEQRRKRQR